jgi:hypothetical protein
MRFKREVPALLVLWALAVWSAAALPALAAQGPPAAGVQAGAAAGANVAVVFLLVLAILWRFAVEARGETRHPRRTSIRRTPFEPLDCLVEIIHLSVP